MFRPKFDNHQATYTTFKEKVKNVTCIANLSYASVRAHNCWHYRYWALVKPIYCPTRYFVRTADNLATFLCRLSKNLGASTSWNPVGLPRPVTGLLYLSPYCSSRGVISFITSRIQGSNPGGGEIFRTRPDRPWGPPSLLYNGYRVGYLFRGKGAGCGADHPHLSTIEVKYGLS
jgi:hypothetical protein